jgi:Leucine Rich repeat
VTFALSLFSWEQPENALSKIQSAGQSIGRVQFSGREFSRGHLSQLIAILERNKQCFSTPTSFLFPGVMLRDDESFDLVFDFLRRWKELDDVQFERGSFLSRAAVNKCLRLHCKKTLSLRFASGGSLHVGAGRTISAERLWLDFCGINAEQLASLLPRLDSTRELDLCRNPLGIKGGLVLAQWKRLNTVGCLDLVSTGVADTGAEAICRAIGNPSSATQTLYLDQNGITDAGITAIVSALEHAPLQSLSLAANELTGERGLALLENAALTRLNVGNNPLKNDFLASLGISLIKRQQRGDAPMELNLAEIKAGPQGWARFFAVLSAAGTTLKALSLEHNHLGHEGRAALLSALSNGLEVQHLNVSQNGFTSAQITTLLQRFQARNNSFLYAGYFAGSTRGPRKIGRALEAVMRAYPLSDIPESLILSRTYAPYVQGVPATVANLFLFSATSVPTSELRRCLTPPSGQQLRRLHHSMPPNIKRLFACRMPALQLVLGAIKTAKEDMALCRLLLGGTLQSLVLRTPAIRPALIARILQECARGNSLRELVLQSSFSSRTLNRAKDVIERFLRTETSLLEIALVGLDPGGGQSETKLNTAFGQRGVLSFKRVTNGRLRYHN